MEALFFYFGKVILISGITFLYYRLFLKDKTFHHYNRFYLLAAVVISLLLPLLKVSYFTLEVNSNMYLLINRLQNLSSSNNSNDDFNYFKIGAFLTGLVALFFLTKLIVGLVKIQVLKKKFNKENFEGISFYQTDLAEAPFSYFKNLFWKNSIAIQSDLGRQILKHEMVHIEQKHSWDKIFLEIMTSFFWFNPFFYLIKKEINLIHEYLADKKALKNSDTKAFAQMLLASHFSGKQFPATSPFLSSNLKKRLTMLKKSKTKFSYARRILALPLLFTLTFMYLVNAKNKEIIETNLEIAQQISEIKKDPITSNISVEKSIQKDKKSISKPKKETNLADKNSIPSEEIAFGTNGTKLYQENPKLFLSNDTIKIENVTDSSEFQQKIKEAKEKQSLIIIKADKIVYTDYSNKKKSSVVNPQISVDNPQIFIDGRSITKEEMDKISPDLIESVYINKKNDNENNYNEIRIFTKK
jgi:beta-lactamase regulating signal transducer with metallopeptidase domain